MAHTYIKGKRIELSEDDVMYKITNDTNFSISLSKEDDEDFYKWKSIAYPEQKEIHFNIGSEEE